MSDGSSRGQDWRKAESNLERSCAKGKKFPLGPERRKQGENRSLGPIVGGTSLKRRENGDSVSSAVC